MCNLQFTAGASDKPAALQSQDDAVSLTALLQSKAVGDVRKRRSAGSDDGNARALALGEGL